jgi:hypothetical protein
VIRSAEQKIVMLALSIVILSGCATWSTGSIDRTDQQEAIANTPTELATIALTEGDITDRKYVSLGDITVTVNKTTVFHSDPTKEQVNAKLKEEAASLGADAVIFVRYGRGGISPLSWGSLEGKGRAIKFQP